MKILYMKNILAICLVFLLYNIEASAQCTEARTPTNVTVVLPGGSSTGDDGGAAICGVPIGSSNGANADAELVDVCIGFDIGCNGDRPATSPCDGSTTDGGVLWHIGFYSQTSPAPNGLNVEYGTGTFIDNDEACNLTQIWDGGTGAGIEDCMYPKASTCFDVIVGQQTDADAGPDELFSVLGAPNACD